jgi:ferredoxin--NADP+ reductase
VTELGSAARPLRVAIVGSGPGGFYAAEALLKSGKTVHVDMFDRLPTPFGLVRGGVAPDHQKIKSVTRVYEKIASMPGFSFWGNVFVGRDVDVAFLQSQYDAVLFASGAESDARLGVPGEDLPGSYTATEFVGWYNGHPDYRDRKFDLSQPVAVVIGQGNVAMDVSRILARTVDELKHTDIAQYALDALAESKVREIHLVGRRGPVQAKFTQPEIREIGELDDCSPIVDPSDLVLNDASRAELDDTDNDHARKNMDVLREFADRTVGITGKRYFIHFFKGPVELRGNGKLEEVVLEKNILVGEPFKQSAKGTGRTERLRCGQLFRSVGYRGMPIPGLPFDERKGVIPNADGRILKDGIVVPGVYVAGWIKRGPSGVIGTNKPDSQETVAALLADLNSLPPCSAKDSSGVRDVLAAKGVRVVSVDDWRKIDSAEIERGKAAGKPREKFSTVAEMLDVLK